MSILRNKLFLIIASAILVVAIGAGIAFAVYVNAPENVAISAVTGVIEDFAEREEISPIVEILKGGSVSISAEKIEDSDGYDVLNGGFINGKVYFSSDAIYLNDIDIKLDGDEISGNLYISNEKIYIEENDVIGGAYALNIESLAEDFKNSIFAYGSKSKYAITDKKLYNAILDALEQPDYKEIKEDATELFEEHFKAIWKIFCENVEFTSENDDVRLNGEKESARVITITVTAKALAATIENVYDYFLNDETIPEFLDKHGEKLYGILKATNAANVSSFSKYYVNNLKDMKSEVKDLCNSVKKSSGFDELIVTMVTPKLGSTLLKLTVETSDEEIFSADFGKDGITDTDTITLCFGNDEFIYEISTNDKKAYKATLEVDGETFLEIAIDKSKKDFEIIFGRESNNYTVEGSYSEKGDATTLNVEGCTYYYSYYDWYTEGYVDYTYDFTTDITVVLNTSDKLTFTPNTYATLSSVTDDILDSWIQKISKLF